MFFSIIYYTPILINGGEQKMDLRYWDLILRLDSPSICQVGISSFRCGFLLFLFKQYHTFFCFKILKMIYVWLLFSDLFPGIYRLFSIPSELKEYMLKCFKIFK